jgi:hypothetical protein
MITLKENEVCSQSKNCSFSGMGGDCPCMGTLENRNTKFACDLLYLEPIKVCSFRPAMQPAMAM